MCVCVTKRLAQFLSQPHFAILPPAPYPPPLSTSMAESLAEHRQVRHRVPGKGGGHGQKTHNCTVSSASEVQPSLTLVERNPKRQLPECPQTPRAGERRVTFHGQAGVGDGGGGERTAFAAVSLLSFQSPFSLHQLGELGPFH